MYRIKKKYYKDNLKYQKYYYIIEEWKVDWLKTIFLSFGLGKIYGWKSVTTMQHWGMDCVREVVEFSTEKEAREYAERLQRRLKRDKIIYL